MKIRTLVSFLLVGGFLLTAMPAQAQRVEGKASDVKSSKRFAKKDVDARVTKKSKKSTLHLYHGLVATLSGIYYSGDVTKPMELLKNGAIAGGGSLTVNYKLTFNEYVSMRFGVQGGLMAGNNKGTPKEKGNNLREFKSMFAEPFVGVEVYPIRNYGFFLYAGIGGVVSNIKYHHTFHINRTDISYEKEDMKEGISSFSPVWQIGVGYNWWLDKDWTLGIELLGQMTFGDGFKSGLDAWPIPEAYGYDTKTGAKPAEGSQVAKAYKSAMDPDGWLQLGIVVSYHFH